MISGKKSPLKKMERAKGVLEMAAKSAVVWETKVKIAEDAKEEFRLVKAKKFIAKMIH